MEILIAFFTAHSQKQDNFSFRCFAEELDKDLIKTWSKIYRHFTFFIICLIFISKQKYIFQ